MAETTCTCSPLRRRGHPPVPTRDPECPAHGWQDAAVERWLRGKRARPQKPARHTLGTIEGIRRHA